jgi:hypothetical protein
MPILKNFSLTRALLTNQITESFDSYDHRAFLEPELLTASKKLQKSVNQT